MKILNYFNPFYHTSAFEKYRELTTIQKIKSIALTAIAAVATLPLLGLGGMVAFRWATHHFTIVNFEAKAAIPLEGMAKKMHEEVRTWLGNCFPNHTVISSGKDLNLKYEKDTLFDIIAESVGKTRKAVIADLKKFIAQHPEKLDSYLARELPNVKKDIETYLCHEYIARDRIVNQHDSGLSYFQSYVDRIRLELFSEIYSLKIEASKIFARWGLDTSISPEVIGDDTMPNQISIVFGEVEIKNGEDSGEVFTEYDFHYLQPRLLQPKV